MGRYGKTLSILVSGALWVVTWALLSTALLATGVSAEILPGSILPRATAQLSRISQWLVCQPDVSRAVLHGKRRGLHRGVLGLRKFRQWHPFARLDRQRADRRFCPF